MGIQATSALYLVTSAALRGRVLPDHSYGGVLLFLCTSGMLNPHAKSGGAPTFYESLGGPLQTDTMPQLCVPVLTVGAWRVNLTAARNQLPEDGMLYFDMPPNNCDKGPEGMAVPASVSAKVRLL
jgi:hypothetical protein